MTDYQPRIGDVIKIERPPYESTATVMRVTEHGIAILHNDDARLVGYPAGHRQWSPGSKEQGIEPEPLTESDQEAFIGRAHWPSLVVIDLDSIPESRNLGIAPDVREGLAAAREYLRDDDEHPWLPGALFRSHRSLAPMLTMLIDEYIGKED